MGLAEELGSYLDSQSTRFAIGSTLAGGLFLNFPAHAGKGARECADFPAGACTEGEGRASRGAGSS